MFAKAKSLGIFGMNSFSVVVGKQGKGQSKYKKLRL